MNSRDENITSPPASREQMLAERVDRLRAVIRNQPMPQSQPTPEADAQGPEQQELRSVRNNVADD